MPTADTDGPLINDAQFLDELERFEHQVERVPDATGYGGAFDGLDQGLGTGLGTPSMTTPPPYDGPSFDEPEEPRATPASAGRNVPFMAAALVIVACLAAGAATAAYVFHDRVTQITATRPASR